MNNVKYLAAALLTVSGLLCNLYAGGTPAGTTISNSVTLSYQVNGDDQDDITASDAGFVVDNKVNFTVETLDTTIVKVSPGQMNAVLTYRLTNNGNSVQDFNLSNVSNTGNPFGATDNFDTDVSIFADTNGNGSYDEGTDQTYVDELAPDNSIDVFMVTTIPADKVDGDVSEHTLLVQVAEGGSSGTAGVIIGSDDSGEPDNPLAVDIVFAEGENITAAGDSQYDGKYTANSAYKVSLALMHVTKSSCVISDPIHGETNPHRIPGAVVRYLIQVDNNGSFDATNVEVTDTIDNTVYNTPQEIIVSNGPCVCTSGGTANGIDSGSLSGSTVTFDLGTISGSNTTKCAFLEVEIK